MSGAAGGAAGGRVATTPLNLLHRHTRRVLERGEEGDAAPPSLLLKSPRGAGAGPARSSDAIAEHYRSLLQAQTVPLTTAGGRELPPQQHAPPPPRAASAAEEALGSYASRPRAAVGPATGGASAQNPLFDKYRARIVPVNMKRPPARAAPVFSEPPPPYHFPREPVSVYAAMGGQRTGAADARAVAAPVAVPAPVAASSAYFSFGVRDGEPSNTTSSKGDTVRGAQAADHTPPQPQQGQSQQEQEQEQQQPSGAVDRRRDSRRDSRRRSYESQMPSDLGTADDEVGRAASPENDGSSAAGGTGQGREDESESEGEDEGEGESEEGGDGSDAEGEEGEGEGAEHDGGGRYGNLGSGDRRRSSAATTSEKYLQMIQQLTDELGKAQGRVAELEGQRERETLELESELADLDKGNLDLHGRAVALQRQVLHLTEERQENLQVIEELERRNAALESEGRKMEEIAVMLQTKAQILQGKLSRAQQQQQQQHAHPQGTGRARAELPASLEDALARLRDAEDLNEALRENIKQLHAQRKP